MVLRKIGGKWVVEYCLGTRGYNPFGDHESIIHWVGPDIQY